MNEEEEVEPQPEREPRESLQIPQVLQTANQEIDHVFPLPPSTSLTFSFSLCQYYLLSQMGAPDIPSEPRETENDQLKRELEALKPELQLIKSEVSPSPSDQKFLATDSFLLSTHQLYELYSAMQ